MVSIIGGGPIGNYTAALLSQAGHKTHVYEEHAVIGKPIQCTGIATVYLGDILNTISHKIPQEFVVNTIDKTRVYSPNGHFVDIGLKKNYIVDRTLFDQYFASVAQEAGACYHYQKRFDTAVFQKNQWTMRFSDGTSATDDLLVGADGPFSKVAKAANLYGKRKFALGAQARMKMHTPIDPSLVEFFLGEGYFGWLVPENETIARVGIASNDKSKFYFDRLKQQRDGEILEWQSGPIPVYDHRLKSEGDHVFLVGDAATHVKATTYGGIIPGLMAAECLRDSFSSGKSYSRLWKKRIGRDLWIHLMIRKALDNFSDADYNSLISLVGQEKIIKVISEHDREFPSRVVPKILLKEPRFLKFAPLVFTL